jgi:hypothetical protein
VLFFLLGISLQKSNVSGLDLRKPARRGEALFDQFDIRVLTPNGVEIELPFQVFKQLKKLHLLERDRITGKRKIKKQALEGAIEGDCFAHLSAIADWRAVYREERRSPGYVIENGRLPVRSSNKLRRRTLP